MATLREYFDTDCALGTLSCDWPFNAVPALPGDILCTVNAAIVQDFEAGAKYWRLYIPSTVENVSNLFEPLLKHPALHSCTLDADGDGVRVEVCRAGDSQFIVSDALKFTGRIILYIDQELSTAKKATLEQAGVSAGFSIVIRDASYVRTRAELARPLGFISHDTRDKDEFVRDLARELRAQRCPVWYDEYSLNVGDSLREKIDLGLRDSKKCILILSPNFFSNTGWGRAEFDSIFTREIVEGNNVILPVWHNVDRAAVFAYNMRIADKVGISSRLGISEVARRLALAMKSKN